MTTCETWMPVSGTFKTYPLQVEILHWEDGPVVYSKGHHERRTFLQAAVEEWAQEEDLGLTLYENNEFYRLEGPIEAPLRLRSIEYIQHDWWATRVWGGLEHDGYKYYVNPVSSIERGAYPVTVVNL